MKASYQRVIVSMLAFTRLRLVALVATIALVAPALFGAESSSTTYSDLLANNTSAALSTTSAATVGPSSANVSKLPISSLLPTGSNARIFAHFLAWFGTPSHPDFGYSSADAVQVQKQVTDMLSRGINGAIINWQGPTDFTNDAALLIMSEAEKHATDFEFAIEQDAQAYASCTAAANCDLATRITTDLIYIQNTYAASARYMKYSGRPVIFLFNMDSYHLDWDKVRAALPGNPIFVFRAADGSTTTRAAVAPPALPLQISGPDSVTATTRGHQNA